MKALKKCLCLIVAILMLVTCVACSKEDGDSSGGGSVAAPEEGWALDFSDKNYNGYDFRVLRADLETGHKWSGSPNDVWVEGVTGDILANSVYYRNETLKEMIGVNIVLDTVEMGDALTVKLSNSIAAGVDMYDLSILHMRGFPTLVNNGYVTDMNSLNVDTTQSWWDQEVLKALNINGSQFAMISDVTFVDKLSTVGVFYNTAMADTLHIPDLYNVVDEGDWTLEVMKTYAAQASGSVSSSGKQIYGISSQNDFSYFVLESANFATVAKNSQSGLTFNLPSNRAVTILMEAFDIMNESYFFNRQTEGLASADDSCKLFPEQNLFLVSILQACYYMKNYSDDYGILPMPKYDDTVSTYYSPINHHAANIMVLPNRNTDVPYTEADYQRTADVLQAWGMISEELVQPEFYDRILSTRLVNDPDSVRMIDIIFEHRVYDIGLIFNFGTLETIVLKETAYSIKQAASTVMSDINTKRTSVPTAIQTFLENIG